MVMYLEKEFRVLHACYNSLFMQRSRKLFLMQVKFNLYMHKAK